MNEQLIQLKNLAIMITDKCNLDCYHCFRVENKCDNEFDYKYINKLADFVGKTSIDYLRITGGEPFLYKNISSVIKQFSKQDITTSIVTNGIVSNKTMLLDLKDSGISEIWFSVHSIRPNTHDKLVMKNGTLKNIIKSIETSIELNIKTNIYLPVSHYNLNDVEETLTWLDNLNVNRVKILRITPLGKALHGSFNHITDIEWQFLIAKIKKMNLDNTSLKIQGIIKNNHVPKCTVLPFKHLNIDTSGNIYPCCLMSGNKEFSIGHINDLYKQDSLIKLANNSVNIMKLKGPFPCVNSNTTKGCLLHSEVIEIEKINQINKKNWR
ncbi:GTP 3',8-cyclase [subsurface metagenome]